MEKKKSSKTGTKKPADKSESKKDFLVVGLGASAGGVKALQEFFATMPPNSGMAFVAILHLSPEHESSLPQILQAQTAMKVTQVTETVKVEPNNVYVIPPNQQLEMVDGVIRPKAAERPLGNRVSIDVFFRTLAEAYEKNAICVVLSGTGSDGTLGLKRVKESHGFAIVQDPEDAEYDSMPRSAINTQLADWVLPVNQMPEKLMHFKDSSKRLHLTNGADASKVAEEIHADESLREILTLLRVRTGHDFSNYKMPTLVRRIARHLQIHELEDIPTYLELLRSTPNELQSLLKNLLINVTNFFRDRDAFEAVKTEIVPNIFAGKAGKDTIRVWSAGCASGEEAYSLAMILTEYADKLPDPPKIQIFASDIDDEAIGEARDHRYPESIEADVSAARLKRFFVKEGSFYRVKKELRETILFAPHDVLRDPPFSRLDMISCRNLFIYLNRETQERVLQIFHFALNSHGYLFLGSSETAENSAILFSPVNKKYRTYSRRNAPMSQTSMPMMPIVGRWEVRLPEIKADAARDRAATLSDIHYKLLEDYAPSSVLVNQDFDIVYLSGTANRFLRFSGGEPSRNLLKAVVPDLLPDLRAALFTAQREHRSSEFPNVRVRLGDESATINLIVRAVETEDETSDFLLVIFEEKNSPAVQREADREIKSFADKDEAMETIVRRLEEDLQRTKEHLRTTIEQHETTVEELKASNEELQAINEELRSASEELETSKEELQSLNEELTTVNSELKENIEESSRVNSDLYNIIQSTDIATIFLDKNLKIKRYTPPIEQLFNIMADDVGRPLEHFTHRLNYEKMTAEAAKVLRSLKASERETADREGNVFMARFLPYRTVDDRIEGVVLNFIDITERKRAEEARRESEERFHLFFAATTEILYRMNADWSKMISLVGKGFLADTRNPSLTWLEEYIPEPDREATKAVIDKAVRTKKTFELEHRVINADGSVGWTFSRAIPLLNASGEIVEWFGAASDITVRKQAEETLRESEEKYRTLFDSIDEGFCTIEVLFDKKGEAIDYRFLETNAAFERQTGLKNAVGKTVREFAPQHEKFWFETYGRVVKTGEAVRFEHEADSFGKFYDVYAFRIGNPEENLVAVLFNDIVKRKRAEKNLRQSEEHHRALINQNIAGIFEIDLDGNVIFFNDEFCRTLGYDCDEISKIPMTEFIYSEDLPSSVKMLEQMRKDKKPFEMEKRFVKKDGSLVWVHNSISPITNDADKINSAVIVSLDITERKHAETLLHESEERTRITLEAAELATWEWNVASGEVHWNKQHFRLFGMKPRKNPLTTDDFFRHVHPDFREYVAAELKKSVEKKVPFDVEFCAVLNSGKVRWMSGYGRVTETDKNGEATKMSGVMFDITERKTAAEALRKSEEQLQLILESTKDYSIITFNLKGIITRWNTGAEKIFGWTEKEMLGIKGDILFTPEDRAANVPAKEFETALKKGRAEDERWHQRKDGSRFFASGVMQPLKDGEVEGFVKIARDQTEKIEAETIMREQELLRQFVRTQEDERQRIARDIHDQFGQQLTALRLKIANLKKTCAKMDAPESEIAAAQIDELQKISEYLDRDVDFLAWELRPASLEDLGLRLTLQNYVKEWENHTGIKTDFHTTGIGKVKLTNETETNIYRIAQESLNNILKHAEATAVSVLLEKRKDVIVLIVEDDGIGFDPDKKRKGAKGLGIVGMHERAKILGGETEIESEKGKGTTVFVRVPVKSINSKE